MTTIQDLNRARDRLRQRMLRIEIDYVRSAKEAERRMIKDWYMELEQQLHDLERKIHNAKVDEHARKPFDQKYAQFKGVI